MVRGQRRRLSAALVLIPPALEALRRGLVIAQDSRNRVAESALAQTLSRLEAAHGDPVAALDHVTLAIRNYHDSGSTAIIRTALAVLAAVLDGLGHREAAATIGGFAISQLATLSFPEINTAVAHLREILGDQIYQSLARMSVVT